MLGRGARACAHELMFSLVSASCAHLLRNSGSRGLAILVDQPAESIKPYDPYVACWSGRRDGSEWWRLVE
jgi:hypothetical protein